MRAMGSSKFVVVTQLPDAGQNFDFSLKNLTIYKQNVKVHVEQIYVSDSFTKGQLNCL